MALSYVGQAETEEGTVKFPSIYTKDSRTVIENAKEAKRQFIEQMMDAAADQGLTSTELGIRADTSPAATNRMKDENENITLSSMTKFAAVVGRKVKIELVPDPEAEAE